MSREIINKISLLNPNLSCLLIGKNKNFAKFSLECFKNYECLEFTNSTVENMNKVLFNPFNIVILVLDKEDYLLFNNYNLNLPEYTIFIIDENLYTEFKPQINKIDFLLINPITIKEVVEKVFKIVLISEGKKLLKENSIITEKKDLKFLSTNFNLFLEQYSGQVMFINNEFSEYLVSLKNFEISKTLFSDISLSLVKLSNVIKEKDELKELSDIFLDLSDFIINLDFKNINASSYEKFDYFNLIIEDIMMYIDELFVRRLFNDVRVFSDSLSNNISYFKEQLYDKKNKDKSSLEFF